ncbi:MAG: sulfotransferase [Deltaproteobacteria bacterium]|nr:sulfotransferase [Deltaproteobacteria bacterium]MBW2360546.1 sulfotransferase [Deltaproteobacteria bacterium]
MAQPSGSPGVERPIFVIGCGRSGTTVVFHALAEHPSLAWISNWSNRFGDAAFWLRLAKLRHAPGVRALGKHGWRPRPVEGYRPWMDCFDGFNRPARDLDARDCSDASRLRMRRLVARHLAVQRKPRFTAKYTGWSRIGFMDCAFPDASYLHVIRDGRAVAASLLQVGFWEGWRGPSQWRWGPLSQEHEELWRASDGSFAVLAGIQWKLLVENIRAAGATIGDRYRELRYEEFVEGPAAALAELTEWCDLEADPRQAERIAALGVRPVGEKWRESLSVEEQRRLGTALAPSLEALGYPV